MPRKWRVLAGISIVVALVAITGVALLRNLPSHDVRVLGGSSTPPTGSSQIPTRLIVGSIHVDAKVEQVGMTPDGNMDTPRDPHNVAWYAPGVKPGQSGDAVVAGHLDTRTGPAVFAHLDDLRVGNAVTVMYAGGGSARFSVSRIATYAFDAEPDYLFGTDGKPLLTLITCTGSWDGTHFDKRLVVDTVPV